MKMYTSYDSVRKNASVIRFMCGPNPVRPLYSLISLASFRTPPKCAIVMDET